MLKYVTGSLTSDIQVADDTFEGLVATIGTFHSTLHLRMAVVALNTKV